MTLLAGGQQQPPQRAHRSGHQGRVPLSRMEFDAARDAIVGVWNLFEYHDRETESDPWTPTFGKKGAMPQDGDHGPYKLVTHDRIAIASADNPAISTVYSYQLDGKTLTLRWIHYDPVAPSGDVGGPFTTIRLFRS